MSSNSKKSRKDSKKRNKARLRRKAIAEERKEKYDIANLTNSVNLMLSQGQRYTELGAEVVRAYLPLLTQDENILISKPLRTINTDLEKLHGEYISLSNETNNLINTPITVGKDNVGSDLNSTILGLNVFNLCDSITNKYNTVVAPLIIDLYNQLDFIINKYGDDRLNEVDENLKIAFIQTKQLVNIKEEVNDE